MSWEIRLRSSDKTVRLSIADTPETGAEWVQDAFVWTNVLRNRARWVNAPAALDALYSDAADQLLAWGFKLEELRSMAGALIVEIDLPDGSDPTALAIRAIPWEFLLRAVLVGKPQGGRSPVLIRHLAVSRKESPPPTPSKEAVFIQSAPGPLADLYDFDEERSLFEAAIAGRSYDFSKDPNLDDVEKIVTRLKPSVVHLTGFDARQGFAALQQTESQYPAEGMYLSSALGQPQVSGPGPLAQALTAKGKHRPSLVTLNLYNSCEIAAAIVSAGASAAIGFMAEFHDATAEVFFMKLYQAWASKLTAAAEDAIAEAVSYLLDDPVSSPHLEGAPIVIWSAQSALNKFSKASARRSQREPGRTRPKRLTPAQVRNMLTPYLDYPQELNYCGLHNSANPFAKPARFGIRKIGLAPVPGLLVQVSISVGGEQSTFTKSIDVDVSNHEINDVTLSLASELVRALREKVQATMTVTLSYEGQKIFEDTKQVGLLATDEWQRTTPWLPSFILPRDPAVLEIVRWAHPVLSAICDSTEAGFDSYQRQTGAAGDEAKDRTIVDQQVRALWWTVKNRGRLRYLGAPPTYTKHAQRIRTPTAILKGRAGTCLDLALLFSACVAAIDVHAVVFVLKGHALPGYFRTPAGHADFERLMASYYTPRTGDLERSDLNRPWIMQPDGLERLIEQIRSGALVPLETVALTEHGGFEQAIDRGSRKLVTEVDNFEAMYDLTLARDHAVTPLPIAGLL